MTKKAKKNKNNNVEQEQKEEEKQETEETREQDEKEEETEEKAQEENKEEKKEEDKSEFFSVLDKLRKELEEKDKKLIEYIQAHKRHVQETDKIRERLRSDFDKKLKTANSELLKRIIPVFDELELAMQHAEKSKDVDSLVNGLKMTLSKLNTELENSGLEKIYNKGKKFNPNVEEAVSIIPVQSEEQDDIIIEVLQAGYQLGDNLIRPAKVVVGKFN